MKGLQYLKFPDQSVDRNIDSGAADEIKANLVKAFPSHIAEDIPQEFEDLAIREAEAGSELGIEAQRELQTQALGGLQNIQGFIGGIFANMDFGKAMLLVGVMLFGVGLLMKGNIGGLPRPVMFLIGIVLLAFGAFSKYGPGHQLGVTV